MHSDLVFFGKFVLGIISKANDKSDNIRGGKERADNELEFEL